VVWTAIRLQWGRHGSNSEGTDIHKINRYKYEMQSNGVFRRTDVTEDFSSPSNAQVNDHHQNPQRTKERLGPWPGFEFL
jgi:hypothetical protein